MRLAKTSMHSPSNQQVPAALFACPSIAADIENLRNELSSTLQSIEHLGYRYYRGSSPEGRTDWEATLSQEEDQLNDILHYEIRAITTRMAVYADALRLPAVHGLLRDWKIAWPESTWRTTKGWSTSEANGVDSEPLSALRPIIDSMLVLTRPQDAPPPDTGNRRGHELLEHALRSIAKICRDRGVVPSREHDVQQVLHSHLEGIFSDYSRNVTISKPIVSFKPDGGVPSLCAAIECKFVDSEGALKTAVHGLTEDLSGYSGSADWTRFYTICYMTEAFSVEGQLVAAMRASQHAGTWTTILVTGGGASKSRIPPEPRATGGTASK